MHAYYAPPAGFITACAPVAELVDATDSKSVFLYGSGSSSLPGGTILRTSCFRWLRTVGMLRHGLTGKHMTKNEESPLGLFGRYLSLWGALCIFIGVLLGNIFPQLFRYIANLEYAQVNFVVAILIWVMIYISYKQHR